MRGESSQWTLTLIKFLLTPTPKGLLLYTTTLTIIWKYLLVLSPDNNEPSVGCKVEAALLWSIQHKTQVLNENRKREKIKCLTTYSITAVLITVRCRVTTGLSPWWCWPSEYRRRSAEEGRGIGRGENARQHLFPHQWAVSQPHSEEKVET